MGNVTNTDVKTSQNEFHTSLSFTFRKNVIAAKTEVWRKEVIERRMPQIESANDLRRPQVHLATNPRAAGIRSVSISQVNRAMVFSQCGNVVVKNFHKPLPTSAATLGMAIMKSLIKLMMPLTKSRRMGPKFFNPLPILFPTSAMPFGIFLIPLHAFFGISMAWRLHHFPNRFLFSQLHLQV